MDLDSEQEDSGQEDRYTLPNRPLPELRRCPGSRCGLHLPYTHEYWDKEIGVCRVCAYNLCHPAPIRIPNPRAHPNHIAYRTRICGNCATVCNNVHNEWDEVTARCRPCATALAEEEAERRVRVVTQEERHEQDEVEHGVRWRARRRPRTETQEAALDQQRAEEDVRRQQHVNSREEPGEGQTTSRIRIGRCSLCCKSFSPGPNAEQSRCLRCMECERCTRCYGIKARSHFERAPEEAGPSTALLHPRCRACRLGNPDQQSRRCTTGYHDVSIEAFGPNARICNDCLARRRSDYAASTMPRATIQVHEEPEDDPPPDDDNDGVQPIPEEDYDAFFADDLNSLSGVNGLPGGSAVNSEEARCISNFDAALAEIHIAACGCCHEEDFNLELKPSGFCARCERDDLKDGVRLWSDENHVNPMPENLRPACLRNLTDMEEMLIARIKPIIQVRWTHGHQLSYKDHVINFQQDISTIAERLPRLPEDLDMVIIRQDGVNMEGHVDFMVRREKVRDALAWKIEHDPRYRDLGAPDEELLSQLPENGTVVERIPICRQGIQNDGAERVVLPTGPIEAAMGDRGVAMGDGESATGDNEAPQIVIGGVLDVGAAREEVVEVREAANAAVGAPYQHTIINAPPLNPTPLNENTPGYITMAFPTLFPDGEGDFHQTRTHPISFGRFLDHLMRFEGGRFARHRRFPWFAFNTLQRQRTHSLAKIFVRQRHDAGRLTAGALKALLQEGDQQIANSMIRFGHTLRGTRAYWLARRNELQDMIRIKGAPHLFFTLSAADLQWWDLHRHMPQEFEPPDSDAAAVAAAARRQRRLALERNPHLAASYLDIRVQAFMKHVLKPLLKVKDFWYRYEWQERGSGHVHGFLWMNGAPNADEIDWSLLKDGAEIPEVQQQKMDAFVDFWKRVVTAFNPFPKEDESAPLSGPHPCNTPRPEMKNSVDELSELLNWVERHTRCTPGYCQIKRKVHGQAQPQTMCRFDYPMQCRTEAGVGFDSKKRVRFEPERNDALLNTFNRVMILAWRANIDVKPVMSTDAALNYIAKYASKSEQQAPAFPQLLSSIVDQLDADASSKTACQKLLNKMLGERTYSAQETAHLLLGIPLVRSSVSFQSLNLAEDGGLRGIEVNAEDEVDDPDQRRVTNQSWLQRYMNRPDSLAQLSMCELFTGYSWRDNQWRKRRAQNVILRTFPRKSPDPAGELYESYCRVKVMLHHPFRDLADLQPNDATWAESWAQCRAAGHEHPPDTLRCWEKENRHQEEDDDDEDEDVPRAEDQISLADWQVFAQAFPNAAIPQYDLEALGTRPIDDGWDLDAARDRWEDVHLMRTWIDEQKKAAGDNDAPNQPDPVDLATLAVEQRQVLDFIKGLWDGMLRNAPVSQELSQIDGSAGCGKTYLIHAICQILRESAAQLDLPNPIRVLAPSGAAALNILGQTLHSALGLPVNTEFLPLTGARLARLQTQWKGVKFLIIDEKSMMGQRTLAMIDARLRQIFPESNNKEFGGLHVLLCGDFAQLPPVGDRPLYCTPKTGASALSVSGSILYKAFATGKNFHLKVLHRQQGETPEQLAFKRLLKNSSRGGLSAEDWDLLSTRSEANLSAAECDSFNDATCLFSTREEVMQTNLSKLQALNLPCARIQAHHDGGPGGAGVSAEDAGGLENHVYLARGAQVMISRNLWSNKGLVNATIGTVEDVVWLPCADRSDLPSVVLVSCPTYTGPTRWRTAPRPGFPQGVPVVPIPPVKSSFEHKGRTLSRSQIPLRLGWAVTIHKSQGLTLRKVKLGLGKSEFASGITFVGLSRVKTLDSLMLVGSVTYARVKRLVGSGFQERLDDFALRYPVSPSA